MKFKFNPLSLVLLALGLAACTAAPPAEPAGRKTIIVTYSVLGSLVRDLAGGHFRILVPMPNGLDPHEWEPSAKDVEAMSTAALIVQNGLGLEGGMQRSLGQMAAAGIPIFTASDHIKIRTVKAGEGLPTGDADQAEGAQDPHLWLDPQRMKAVLAALTAEIQARFGVDLTRENQALAARLDTMDAALFKAVAMIPAADRLLVTGHESLGYLAEHYGFTLVGAIIPGLTTQAGVSAHAMAALKAIVTARKVRVIFTELGTPPRVSQALAEETGSRCVEIATHILPADGSYFSMINQLVGTIVSALKRTDSK